VARDGLRILREPRWAGLAVLVILLIPAFGLLSAWQVDRLEQRRDRNDLIQQRTAAPAAPLRDLRGAAAAGPGVLDWRLARAEGAYEPAGQRLVRSQPLGGRPGLWVLTPLATEVGTLPVLRGWIPAVQQGTAPALAPPVGPVDLTCRLRSIRPGPPPPSDLPPGQVNDIPEPADPALPGYACDLVSSEPPADASLTLLPPPALSEGSHLSYAVQWVAFAVIAVLGFAVLLRREVHDRRRMPEAAQSPAGTAN